MSSDENKSFLIKWPFYRCEAILPIAASSDIFVWLYLSLLVYENKKDKKAPLTYSEVSLGKVRADLKAKFPQTMNDTLISEIEESIKKNFTESVNTQYNKRKLRDDVMSFLDSFEYLFSNDVEIKTIYKEAVSGAILPFFDKVESKPFEEKCDFELKPLRGKEPSRNLVLSALRTSEKIKSIEGQKLLGKAEPFEEATSEPIFEFDPEEEAFFEDDVVMEEAPKEEDEERVVPSKDGKRTIKVLDDSYQLVYYNVCIRLGEDGILQAELPYGFPSNSATLSWFNAIYRRAYSMNKNLKQAIDAFFPEPEPEASPAALKELFSANGSLERCQELYEILGHSKTKRSELQMEAIYINDNFSAKSGPAYVGRLLDYLGRTIPDTTIRTNVKYESFKIFMKDACQSLGLSDQDAYMLSSENIFKEYTRPKKNPDKMSFKYLFANAILNNLACINNPCFYQEVVQDAWDLYNKRSGFDHPNGSEKLNEDDIKKLTKLAKFIVSIQGGKSL